MKDQITYKGRNVAFTVKGKGFPVLFLHGFCEDSSIWDDFAPPIAESGNRVICVNLPGFGASEPLPEEISIDGMARVVLAVADHLALERFILIGHSMGGYVGLAISELAGGRLAGLGLFHSHPYADSEEKKSGRDKGVAFILKFGHSLFVKQLMPTLFAPEFAAGNIFLVDKLIQRASQYPQVGILNALEAMKNRPDRSDILSAAAFPVLFILGEKDQAIPRELDHRQTTLPQLAMVHVLEKAGHMGMLEAPAATRKICEEFIRFCLR